MNICKCGCNLECKKLWIKGHSSRDRVHSEETRKRISEGNKGKTKSEETRKRMSERVLSEETRRKMSESLKGRIASEETRKKLREASKGKPKTEETKQKMSEGNKGKTASEETRKKLSESNKGRKPANPYGRSKWIPYMEVDLSISKMPSYEYHTRVYLDQIDEPYLWCAKGNYPQHIMRLSNGTAYYPDFYLPTLNVYLDPKGFWQNLEKKALVEAEYPNQCYHFLGDTYLQQIKKFIQNRSILLEEKPSPTLLVFY